LLLNLLSNDFKIFITVANKNTHFTHYLTSNTCKGGKILYWSSQFSAFKSKSTNWEVFLVKSKEIVWCYSGGLCQHSGWTLNQFKVAGSAEMNSLNFRIVFFMLLGEPCNIFQETYKISPEGLFSMYQVWLGKQSSWFVKYLKNSL
jgi:hypothetical protein